MRHKLIVLILLGLVLFTQANAQATSTDAYFLSPDDNGVVQVWHGGDMITAATASITAYTVSHDSLSIAYISAGQLWLDQAAELVVIADPVQNGFLLFSPDDSQLVYVYDGVWIYRTDGSAAPRQIIADIPHDAADVTTLRDYYPRQFTPDGKWLTLVIGLWEHTKVGVLNLETGEVFEVESSNSFNKIQALADGQVALWGYSEQYTYPDIHLAAPDNFDELSTLMDLYAILPDIAIISLLEIEPDALRVLSLDIVNNAAVIFDYDRTTNTLTGEVQTIPLPTSDESLGKTFIGTLSPDGNLLSIYVNAFKYPTYDSIPTGELMIYDLITGTVTSLDGFDSVSSLSWK